MADSSDLRNAFFAVLRQAVKAATGHVLASSPAVDILDAQQDTLMNECKLSTRRALLDRAQGYIHPQSLSFEAENAFPVDSSNSPGLLSSLEG